MGQVHNGLERAGNLTAALKDALNATDSEGGLERFGETMTPVIDIWNKPEWAFLRSESLVAGFRFTPAVVGEFSNVALLNPGGSKVLCVVEAASVDHSVAGLVCQLNGPATEAAINATLAGATPGGVRDSRFPNVLANSICKTLVGSDPALGINGPNLESRRKAAAETVDFQTALPVILSPGFGLVISANLVNTQFNGGFGWRERPCFLGELG